MGLLAFLQRRQSDKTSLSTAPSTVTFQHSNTSSTKAKIRSRSDADLLQHQHTHRPQYANQAQHELTTTTSPSRPNESKFPDSGRRLSARSSYSDLLLLRTSSFRGASTVSSAGRHVDLLDAQGQLGPSDFKARLQASGSREYGEDVAERNIGQNGLLLGSPAIQKFYASQATPRRPHIPAAKYRRYASREVILEQPEMEDTYRPSSRASVHTARSMPITRTRVLSLSDHHPLYAELPQTTGRRASLASSHATTASSIGLPKLEEGAGGRAAPDAEESDDAAFPPSIPRFRRSELELGVERPLSAVGGSVRRARQSVDMMSAYHMGEPVLHDDSAATTRPASREGSSHRSHRRSTSAIQRQNLSVENMLRWRQTFGELDDSDDQRSVATERATESRASSSRRQWSIASTEPTERSDVSSVCPRPVSRATATTSVDMRSLLDLPRDEDDDACSITTDGSNVDAFVEKRRRRAAPEDQALLFDEAEFVHGGGVALPGLFDNDAAPQAAKRDSDQTLRGQQVMEAPPKHAEEEEEDARPRSPPESPPGLGAGGATAGDTTPEDELSSAATPELLPGAFVPRMYLTQRQRLLALGFDYDTDEDEELDALSSDDASLKQQQQQQHRPRLSIIVEGPPQVDGDDNNDDGAAAMAARRRREAKRLSRCSGVRVRRVEALLEEEGNLADVE